MQLTADQKMPHMEAKLAVMQKQNKELRDKNIDLKKKMNAMWRMCQELAQSVDENLLDEII